jgi:hypothetical protein
MQGAIKAHVELAVDIAQAATNKDPLAGITAFVEIPLRKEILVENGVYGFRTFGRGSPGPNFAAYPQSLGGVIMRNQFFTLRKGTT